MKGTVADSMQSPGKEGPSCSRVAVVTRGAGYLRQASLFKAPVMFAEPRLPALSRGRLDLTSESGSHGLIAQWVEV